MHLGGKRTYSFISGPMVCHGKRLNKNNLSTAGEFKINFGRPSSETLQKFQNAYTYESGVLKFLSLSDYKLCENSYDP